MLHQGSVLSPVLFLIYVNDIGLNIYNKIRLFGDDILLYQPIRTPDDHLQLQEDLNTLTKPGQLVAPCLHLGGFSSSLPILPPLPASHPPTLVTLGLN